ncbi:hypothetical protein GpartN1_g2447.t1 [Galdieria partita]|uniref:Uncharacterized protein n=1 Tax=Galdieria partita TaxID=83374 RepID=A0A9C7PUI6_9RHOD|nr:hypothetical protein GpartN1_g2447.t1 [Galdieria partita]
MASYKTQVESGNEASTFELSREAEEAALKARNLRRRIERFFSHANESDKGDSEDMHTDSELTENIFYGSKEDQYNLLEAIEQLEGAARALKEVSLDSSSLRFNEDFEIRRETDHHSDNKEAVELDESIKSQSTEETGASMETLEVSDFEWEILTRFKPSKSLRERLLQNNSQRRWRDEALELVRESKHLTMLWNNTL